MSSFSDILTGAGTLMKSKMYQNMGSNADRVENYYSRLQKLPQWQQFGFTAREESKLKSELASLAGRLYPEKDNPSLLTKLAKTSFNAVADVGEQIPRVVVDVGKQIPRAAAILPNLVATATARLIDKRSPNKVQAIKDAWDDLNSGKSINMTEFMHKYEPKMHPDDRKTIFNSGFWNSLGSDIGGNVLDIVGNLSTYIIAPVQHAIGGVLKPTALGRYGTKPRTLPPILQDVVKNIKEGRVGLTVEDVTKKSVRPIVSSEVSPEVKSSQSAFEKAVGSGEVQNTDIPQWQQLVETNTLKLPITVPRLLRSVVEVSKKEKSYTPQQLQKIAEKANESVSHLGKGESRIEGGKVLAQQPKEDFLTTSILSRNSKQLLDGEDLMIDGVNFKLRDIQLLNTMQRLDRVPGFTGMFDDYLMGKKNLQTGKRVPPTAQELKVALSTLNDDGGKLADGVLDSGIALKRKTQGNPDYKKRTSILGGIKYYSEGLGGLNNVYEQLTGVNAAGTKLNKLKLPEERLAALKGYLDENLHRTQVWQPSLKRVGTDKNTGKPILAESQTEGKMIRSGRDITLKEAEEQNVLASQASPESKSMQTWDLTDKTPYPKNIFEDLKGKGLTVQQEAKGKIITGKVTPTKFPLVTGPTFEKDEIKVLINPIVNRESQGHVLGHIQELVGKLDTTGKGLTADEMQRVRLRLGTEGGTYIPRLRLVIMSFDRPNKPLDSVLLHKEFGELQKILANNKITNPRFAIIDNPKEFFNPATYTDEIGEATARVFGNKVTGVSYHVPGLEYEPGMVEDVILNHYRGLPAYVRTLVETGKVSYEPGTPPVKTYVENPLSKTSNRPIDQRPIETTVSEGTPGVLKIEGRTILDPEEKCPVFIKLYDRLVKGVMEEKDLRAVAEGGQPLPTESLGQPGTPGFRDFAGKDLNEELAKSIDEPDVDSVVDDVKHGTILIESLKAQVKDFGARHGRIPDRPSDYTEISRNVANQVDSMLTPAQLVEFNKHSEPLKNLIDKMFRDLKEGDDLWKVIFGDMPKINKLGGLKSLLYSIILLGEMANVVDARSNKKLGKKAVNSR
jgi:hypothetical protein